MQRREIPWQLSLSQLFTGYEDYPYALGAKLPPAIIKPGFNLDIACLLADLSQIVYLQTLIQIEGRLSHIEFSEVLLLEQDGMRALMLKAKDCALLIFRGTLVEDFDHIITDLRILPHRYGQRGRVHEGFLSGLKSLWPKIHAQLKTLPTSTALYFAGHSLGAAMAHLAFEHVSRHYNNTVLYTFGSPRIGDDSFGKSCPKGIYRVVNNNDMIPHLPPPGLYHHIGNLIYIDSDGAIISNPGLWLQIKEMFRGNHQFFQDILNQWGEGNFDIPPIDALMDHSPLHYSIRLWNARCP